MERDYSRLPPGLPVPEDDGAADHLKGLRLPSVALPSTAGGDADLARLGTGLLVVYVYPRTGVPGEPLIDGWDEIPGARGCTPQSCAFRDHFTELTAAGANQVFGLSTQDTAYQAEAVARLQLPFAILSDEAGALANAVRLPTMQVADVTLLKRLAMVIDDGHITKVFYPVFPPDRNAGDVLAWLQDHPRP